MSRWWGLVGGLTLLLVVSGVTAQQPGRSDKKAAGKEVFGLTKVWDIDLQLSAKEWTRMQPAGGRGFPGFGPPGGPGSPGGPPRPPAKPAEKTADSHKSGFGMEFPWAHADFTAEGQTFRNVAIRYKGNFTYMASAGGLKRSLKIDINRSGGRRFHGLKKINLNSGVTDPTRACEALSFAVFRAAGVPASRTAYARVTLTVPGKYDKEYVGLYTLIEQVDKVFLEDRFQSAKGLLLKPEGMRNLEYLGDNWEPYEKRYRPKTTARKKQQKRLIEFLRLVNQADDKRFRKEIGAYLDVDQFLRFVAVNALLVNLDSFLGMGHNYYLYLRPDTSRFVFIPWDLDLALGKWPMGGTVEQQMGLSLHHPHVGPNKLIDRLLALKDVKEKYQRVLKELAATCFARERLLKDLDALDKAAREPLAREATAVKARKERAGGFGPPGGGMFGRGPSLKTFLEKRTESVVAQLAGNSKGYVPAGMGFGGPPGVGRPGGAGPGGFGPGNFLAKPLLAAMDANKDGKVSKDEALAAARRFFKDCDKANTGALEEKALAEGLNRIMAPPPGFGPPPGPGGRPGGFGPPRFGPGNVLAGAVLRRADANKDGKVTLAEWLAAVAVMFKECDKDKNGTLDEKEIGAGVNLLFPPPPGFGRPGARPEEPRKREEKP